MFGSEQNLYFLMDRNISLKSDVVFDQVMVYSVLGEQLDVTGGERETSERTGHGNQNEAILCLSRRKEQESKMCKG